MKKETKTHFRIIEMLYFLTSNYATVEDLQERFKLSKRIVMYYLSAYKKTGFKVETKTDDGFKYHIKIL